MRHTALIRDGWRDSDLYAVLEHEWRARQSSPDRPERHRPHVFGACANRRPNVARPGAPTDLCRTAQLIPRTTPRNRRAHRQPQPLAYARDFARRARRLEQPRLADPGSPASSTSPPSPIARHRAWPATPLPRAPSYQLGHEPSGDRGTASATWRGATLRRGRRAAPPAPHEQRHRASWHRPGGAPSRGAERCAGRAPGPRSHGCSGRLPRPALPASARPRTGNAATVTERGRCCHGGHVVALSHSADRLGPIG